MMRPFNKRGGLNLRSCFCSKAVRGHRELWDASHFTCSWPTHSMFGSADTRGLAELEAGLYFARFHRGRGARAAAPADNPRGQLHAGGLPESRRTSSPTPVEAEPSPLQTQIISRRGPGSLTSPGHAHAARHPQRWSGNVRVRSLSAWRSGGCCGVCSAAADKARTLRQLSLTAGDIPPAAEKKEKKKKEEEEGGAHAQWAPKPVNGLFLN